MADHIVYITTKYYKFVKLNFKGVKVDHSIKIKINAEEFLKVNFER